MKKILIIALSVFFAGALIFACKKSLNDQGASLDGGKLSGKGGKGVLSVTCDYETISGHITANRTLSAPTIYKLDGCVTVDAGVTLTINAGVVVQGMKTSTTGSKSVLIVEKGAKLVANGTTTNPVVFTSDQAAGSRAAGDWVGVRIFGEAPNNNSNNLGFDLGCATYYGGGTNSASNSGVLQNVQIHFAGATANLNDFSQAGLALNSVGTGTVIDQLQITNSLNDNLFAAGGTVKLTNVASYNADRTDFRVSFGNVSKMQFLAAMRLNNSAVPSSLAYGVDVTNHTGTAPSGPQTKPVISNLTILGPNYCDGSSVNSNFRYGVRLGNNTGAGIYNSVISSWNTSATSSGFIIDGASTIANTASNAIEFSYNSFHNSGSVPYLSNPANWALNGGCDNSTMQDWIEGTGSASCIEDGNEISVSTLGYNSTFCSNFCDSFSSNFILGTTTLASPDFSWTGAGSFSSVSYRGAFGTSTDWTKSWADWCPQSTVYCTP